MPPPALGKAESFQCVVPEEHVAGEKLCYLEPSGSRIFLDVPPDAKPGETIEFELPDDGPPPTLSQMGKSGSFQCVVPDHHTPGEVLCWGAPDGSRHFLDVPADVKPGTKIEFEVSARIMHGRTPRMGRRRSRASVHRCRWGSKKRATRRLRLSARWASR